MYLKRAARVAFVLALFPFAASAQTTNADVESTVRAKFAATPVMIEIARCESKFRQFTDSGNPLFGGMNSAMVGVYQIYHDIHQDDAAALGMDLLTLEGNVDYAKYLYDRQGSSPWMSSFPCWGKETDVPAGGESTPVGAPITKNLSLGMIDSQIQILQQILNEKGYTIASEGPGSPGQETEKFGSLTRTAVRAFQCAHKIACSGDEGSTGWGFVGAKTRVALASNVIAAPPGVTVPDPASTSSGSSTASVEEQIAALQKQIAELTAVLQSLLAAQNQ